MKNTQETGRSMLEMLAVIAVISVITVGGASALSYQLTLFRASHVQTEVQEIIRGVTDLYTWNRDFTKLDMDTVCENDVLQKTCKGKTNEDGTSEKYWENAFGGQITVKATALTYGTYTKGTSNSMTDTYRPDRSNEESQSGFTVTYTRVPKQACEQFVCYTKWSDARILNYQNESNTDCSTKCGDSNDMIFAPKTF